MFRLRLKKDIPFPDTVRAFLHAEKVRQDVRAELAEEIENMLPLVLSDYDPNIDPDSINAETTYSLFALNRALAHTKELGIKKKRYTYITALFERGLKVIKNKRNDI